MKHKYAGYILAALFTVQTIIWPVPSSGQSIWSRYTPARAAGNIHPAVDYASKYGFHIPEQFGTVVSADKNGAESGKETVILIKDAHCNFEAQTNIAKILDILTKDYGIKLICVEGARGSLDTGTILGTAGREEREKTARRYLRKGWLTAGEALAVQRGRDYGFSMWGAEDLGLYLQDIKYFRDVYTNSAPAEQFVKVCAETIERLKQHIYTAPLLEFDRNVISYRQSRKPLSEFIEYLFKGYKDRFVKYDTLLRTLRAGKYGKYINFKEAEKERSLLIKYIQKNLVKEDVRKLVEMSLLFRLGKISSGRYYGFLSQYNETRKYANLYSYIHAVKLRRLINEDILFTELDTLIEDIYTSYAKDPVPFRLHQEDTYINTLSQLVRLEIRRADIKRYGETGKAPEKTAEFLLIQSRMRGITAPHILSDAAFIKQAKGFFRYPERFYDCAIKRDKALSDNLIKKMRGGKEKRAALVAGGFHTEGIKKLLEREGIHTIVISPSITKDDPDAKRIYLSRIMDHRFNPGEIAAEKGIANVSAPDILAPDWMSKYTGILEKIRKSLKGEEIQPAGETEGEFLENLRAIVNEHRNELEKNKTLIQLLMELGVTPSHPTVHHMSWLRLPEGSKYKGPLKKKTIVRYHKLTYKGISIRYDNRFSSMFPQIEEIIKEAIEDAMEKARKMGYTAFRTKKNWRIDILEASHHMGENHKADGFIGINKMILNTGLIRSIKREFGSRKHKSFLQMILAHEMAHELTGKGEEIEQQLIQQDIDTMNVYMGRGWESVIGRYCAIEGTSPEKVKRRLIEMRPQEPVTEHKNKRHTFAGDVHGNISGLLDIMEHAGLISTTDRQTLIKKLTGFKNALFDEKKNIENLWPGIMKAIMDHTVWTGGDQIFVQTGDLLDRGKYGIESLLFLSGLKAMAEQNRGDVVLLCGNHELGYLKEDIFSGVDISHYRHIQNVLNALVENRYIQAAYKYNGLYAVHGGLTKDMEDQIKEETGKRNPQEEDVAGKINEIFFNAVRDNNYKHKLFSGGRTRLGGIFWTDFTKIGEDAPLQIVGHTTHHFAGKPWNSKTIDIDFGISEHYGNNIGYLTGSPAGEVLRGYKLESNGAWNNQNWILGLNSSGEIDNIHLENIPDRLWREFTQTPNFKKIQQELVRYCTRESYAYDENTLAPFVRLLDEFGPLYGSRDMLWRSIRDGYINKRAISSKTVSALKAPGTKPVTQNEDADIDIEFVNKFIEGVKEAGLPGDRKKSISDVLSLPARAPPEKEEPVDLGRVKFFVVESDLLGIPRKHTTNPQPQDLIYALGENINGELNITVTSTFWEEYLINNPLLFAFLIDHEWQENIVGKSHRTASERAWLFRDASGMNPFYRFYIDSLNEAGEEGELQNLALTEHENDSGDIIKKYARRLLLGRMQMAEADIINRAVGSKEMMHLYAWYPGSGVKMVIEAHEKTAGKNISANNIAITDTEIKHIMARIRYRLQGEEGNLSPEEWEKYEEFCKGLTQQVGIDRKDVLVIHNHEFLGIVPAIRKIHPGIKIIWQCHLDLDAPNPQVWAKMKEYVNQCDMAILQPRENSEALYSHLGINIPAVFIPPAVIDPSGDRDRQLTENEIEEQSRKLADAGIRPGALPYFLCINRAVPHKGIIDTLKAYRLFREKAGENPPHLVLGLFKGKGKVYDDEMERIKAELAELPENTRKDIHIITLEDPYYLTINYLQANALAGIQLPQREGFGLQVEEMMYKGKPVIGRRTGGIAVQIRDGVTGFLADTPQEAADKMILLAGNKGNIRENAGRRAGIYARDHFLASNLLVDYSLVFEALAEEWDIEGPLDISALYEKMWERNLFKDAVSLQKRLKEAIEEKDTREALMLIEQLYAVDARIEKQLTSGGKAASLVFEKAEDIIYEMIRGKETGILSFSSFSLPMAALNKISYETANRFKDIFYAGVTDYIRNKKKPVYAQYRNTEGNFEGFAGTTLYVLGLDKKDAEEITVNIFENALRAVGLPKERLNDFSMYAGQAEINIGKELFEKEGPEQHRAVEALIRNTLEEAVGRARALEKSDGFLQERESGTRVLAEKDSGKAEEEFRDEIEKYGKDAVPEGIYAPGTADHGKIPRLAHEIGHLHRRYRELVQAVQSGYGTGIMPNQFFWTFNYYLLESLKDPRYEKTHKFAYFRSMLTGGFKEFTEYTGYETGLIIPKMGDEIWVYRTMPDGTKKYIFLELAKFNAFNRQVHADTSDTFYHAILERVIELEGDPDRIQSELFDKEVKAPGGQRIMSEGAVVKKGNAEIKIEPVRLYELDAGKTYRLKDIPYHASEKVMINGKQQRLWMYSLTLKGKERNVVVFNNRIYTAEGKGDEKDITDELTEEEIEDMKPVYVKLGVTVTTDENNLCSLDTETIADLNTYQKKNMEKNKVYDAVDIIIHKILKIAETSGIAIDEAKTKNAVIGILRGGKDMADMHLLLKNAAGIIDPDKFIALLIGVGSILDPVMKHGPKKRAMRVTAGIIEEIIKEIKNEKVRKAREEEIRKGEEPEKTLMDIMKHLAAEKGVDPHEVESIFDLFKQGIDLLVMYPELDPGEVDGNYFRLIEQLERLTGIKQGIIINAFQDRLGRTIQITQGRDIERTPLWYAAKRIAVYNSKTKGGRYYLRDADKRLFHTDLAGGVYVENKGNNRNRVLSEMDVVRSDTERIKIDETTKGKTTPSAVIIRFSDWITVHKDGSFSFRPGIQSVLNALSGDNKLVVITETDKQREVLKKVQTENILEGNNIPGIEGNYNTVWLLQDREKAGELAKEGKKTVLMSEESAFHLSLYFAFLYAKTPEEDTGALIWDFFKQAGMEDEEIREAQEEFKRNGIILVKFTSIEETLKRFQMIHFYVETAA